MALHGFEPSEPILYRPEYGGNRESDDPCVVALHYVPFVKIQALEKRVALIHKMREQEGVLDAYAKGQKLKFTENVESIKGFFVKDREVVDPEEFYIKAPKDLLLELLTAMENIQQLNMGMVKEGPKGKEKG
jgi:hypothetical protein